MDLLSTKTETEATRTKTSTVDSTIDQDITWHSDANIVDDSNGYSETGSFDSHRVTVTTVNQTWSETFTNHSDDQMVPVASRDQQDLPGVGAGINSEPIYVTGTVSGNSLDSSTYTVDEQTTYSLGSGVVSVDGNFTIDDVSSTTFHAESDVTYVQDTTTTHWEKAVDSSLDTTGSETYHEVTKFDRQHTGSFIIKGQGESLITNDDSGTFTTTRSTNTTLDLLSTTTRTVNDALITYNSTDTIDDSVITSNQFSDNGSYTETDGTRTTTSSFTDIQASERILIASGNETLSSVPSPVEIPKIPKSLDSNYSLNSTAEFDSTETGTYNSSTGVTDSDVVASTSSVTTEDSYETRTHFDGRKFTYDSLVTSTNDNSETIDVVKTGTVTNRSGTFTQDTSVDALINRDIVLPIVEPDEGFTGTLNTNSNEHSVQTKEGTGTVSEGPNAYQWDYDYTLDRTVNVLSTSTLNGKFSLTVGTRSKTGDLNERTVVTRTIDRDEIGHTYIDDIDDEEGTSSGTFTQSQLAKTVTKTDSDITINQGANRFNTVVDDKVITKSDQLDSGTFSTYRKPGEKRTTHQWTGTRNAFIDTQRFEKEVEKEHFEWGNPGETIKRDSTATTKSTTRNLFVETDASYTVEGSRVLSASGDFREWSNVVSTRDYDATQQYSEFSSGLLRAAAAGGKGGQFSSEMGIPHADGETLIRNTGTLVKSSATESFAHEWSAGTFSATLQDQTRDAVFASSVYSTTTGTSSIGNGVAKYTTGPGKVRTSNYTTASDWTSYSEQHQKNGVVQVAGGTTDYLKYDKEEASWSEENGASHSDWSEESSLLPYKEVIEEIDPLAALAGLPIVSLGSVFQPEMYNIVSPQSANLDFEVDSTSYRFSKSEERGLIEFDSGKYTQDIDHFRKTSVYWSDTTSTESGTFGNTLSLALDAVQMTGLINANQDLTNTVSGNGNQTQFVYQRSWGSGLSIDYGVKYLLGDYFVARNVDDPGTPSFDWERHSDEIRYSYTSQDRTATSTIDSDGDADLSDTGSTLTFNGDLYTTFFAKNEYEATDYDKTVTDFTSSGSGSSVLTDPSQYDTYLRTVDHYESQENLKTKGKQTDHDWDVSWTTDPPEFSEEVFASHILSGGSVFLDRGVLHKQTTYEFSDLSSEGTIGITAPGELGRLTFDWEETYEKGDIIVDNIVELKPEYERLYYRYQLDGIREVRTPGPTDLEDNKAGFNVDGEFKKEVINGAVTSYVAWNPTETPYNELEQLQDTIQDDYNDLMDELKETLDNIQRFLDWAGFGPGPIGIVADLVNAGISLVRGDRSGALLNSIAAIPLAGDAIKAGKMAVKSSRAAGLFAGAIKNSSKVVRGGGVAFTAVRNATKTAGHYTMTAMKRAKGKFDDFVCQKFYGNTHCFVEGTPVYVYPGLVRDVDPAWVEMELPSSQGSDLARGFGIWIALTTVGLVVVVARKDRRTKRSERVLRWESPDSNELLDGDDERVLEELERDGTVARILRRAEDSVALDSAGGETTEGEGGEFDATPIDLVGYQLDAMPDYQEIDRMELESLEAASRWPEAEEGSEKPMTSGLDQYDIFTADDFGEDNESVPVVENETRKSMLQDEVRYVSQPTVPVDATSRAVWDETDVSDSGNLNSSRLTIFGLLLAAVAGLVIFFSNGGFTSDTGTSSRVRNHHRADVDQTPTTSSGLQILAIEDIHVGMRVPAVNPQLSATDRAEKLHVDPETWRVFQLELEKENGQTVEITLLRPIDWMVERVELAAAFSGKESIDAHSIRRKLLSDATTGFAAYLDLAELGAEGLATIKSVDSAPIVMDGPGQIVTATFKHESAEVFDFTIENQTEPIGVTASHPVLEC